jgi:hypothetical protein
VDSTGSSNRSKVLCGSCRCPCVRMFFVPSCFRRRMPVHRQQPVVVNHATWCRPPARGTTRNGMHVFSRQSQSRTAIQESHHSPSLGSER